MAWSGLARGWTLLAVGYQGLVLFGSFSVGDAVAAPELVMIAGAVGLFGLVLASASRLVWIFVALIVGFPLAAVLVPAWEAQGLSASWATLAFALMALACVRVARNPDPFGERR
jgi:hypothetical protein